MKFIGDDLKFCLKDEDVGKDEKIGEATLKLSSFVAAKEWDEWYIFEHKGKQAGKLRIRSVWKPDQDEEDSLEKL